MATESAELGAKVWFTAQSWKRRTPEIVERVHQVLRSALRSKGVQVVHIAEPYHREAYTDDDGNDWPEVWELNASGYSLCISNGHIPNDEAPEPVRSFMCGRCKQITDRAAFETFAYDDTPH